MNNVKKHRFIALTANEVFWGGNEEIIFLGEWCKKYSRREYVESLNSETMPSWIKTKEQVCDSITYVEKIYEKLLPCISEELNSFHNEYHTIRYWRILIGPWLLFHINIFYDRYMLITKAINMYPGFKTIGMHADCYVVPSETHAYINLCGHDDYNLQIFSNILSFMGKSFEKLSPNNLYEIDNKKKTKFTLKHNVKLFFKNFITVTLNKISSIFYKDDLLVINKVYLPFALITKLRLKTYGKLVHYEYDFKKKGIEHENIDYNFRKNIKLNIDVESEFEQFLITTINSYIPCSFIENFERLKRDCPRYFPKKPYSILTPSLTYNEILKQWAADCAEKGTLLFGIQHGGSNFIIDQFQTEDHDIKINDKYFSWGGSNNCFKDKIIPLAAINFITLRESKINNSSSKILFASTLFPRYVEKFHSNGALCYNFNHYIDQQFTFVNMLNVYNKAKLTIRPFMIDYGWEYKDRWASMFPDINLDSDGSFNQVLADCRIFVCDNISTVWIEGLSLNKPTIMYLDFEQYSFTEKALYYLMQLKTVGILHDSPEGAANKVNNVYNDLTTWWNKPTLQNIRKEVCYNYARKSTNTISDLASSISGIRD